MNRIDKVLAELRTYNKKMLSPYITAGDPALGDTVMLMHALVKAGADILEIGIPFSDPMAEGLVIQAAMERALHHDINCDKVLDMVRLFRMHNQSTPVVLMGYTNPVEYYGYARFAKTASQAGVDGTILVDLPPEESTAIKPIWETNGLYSIYLCSPTTTTERMKLINNYAKGYLYYISLKGVTGSDDFDLNTVKTQYQQKKLQTTLPLMIGFGIKTAAMAAQIVKFSDGIIIGAALITKLLEAYKAHKISQDIIASGTELLHEMRQAIDNEMISK